MSISSKKLWTSCIVIVNPFAVATNRSGFFFLFVLSLFLFLFFRTRLALPFVSLTFSPVTSSPARGLFSVLRPGLLGRWCLSRFDDDDDDAFSRCLSSLFDDTLFVDEEHDGISVPFAPPPTVEMENERFINKNSVAVRTSPRAFLLHKNQ